MYYKKASDKNLTHHWTLVQFLSLDTVLNGKISDMDYWHSARKAVNISLANNPDSWAYGSLIELLLLDANPEPDTNQKINTAVDCLIEKCKKENDSFPLESSWYQVNRYNTWWVKENGYLLDGKIRANNKDILSNILQKLQQAISDKKAYGK
jgi:hypothetical protein